MRAQHLPQPFVAAFAQQIFVQLAQHRAESERIITFPFRTMALPAQTIVRFARKLGHKQPRRTFYSRRQPRVCRLSRQYEHPFGTRIKPQHHPFAAALVQPQHRERVAMTPLGNRLCSTGVDQQISHGNLLILKRRLDRPDVFHIAANGAIRAEKARTRRVQCRHFNPTHHDPHRRYPPRSCASIDTSRNPPPQGSNRGARPGAPDHDSGLSDPG